MRTYQLTEIAFGVEGGPSVRVRPRSSGVSLVPVALPSLHAADLARSARATLAHRRPPASALSTTEVTLMLGPQRVRVADDWRRDVRTLEVFLADGTRRAAEADTSDLAGDAEVEALLAHVAIALGAELVEDVGPALATTERSPVTKDVSPKEQALARAHERLRSAGLELKRLDVAERAPVFPATATLAVLGGALVVVLLAGLLLPESIHSTVFPIVMLAVLLALGGFAWRAVRRARSAPGLEAARGRAREARQKAREERHELAETLRKRDRDPDEILARYDASPLPPGFPAIIGRDSFTSADMQQLSGLGRPIVVFVDRAGLLFPDDFAEALTPLEPRQE